LAENEKPLLEFALSLDFLRNNKNVILRLDASFEQVKNWLTNSGVFVSNSSDSNFGGLRSFYDEKKKEFAFLYPEITGYYISSMRFLYEHEKIEKFVELAKISSDWLIKLYDKYGGIIQGIGTDTSKNRLVYSFDTAICAKGLLDCFELTKDSKYLEFSKELLTWISSEALEEDGTLKPFKNLESNEFQESKKVWYTQKGCLNIKSTIPFLQFHKLTNEDQFLKIGIKIADSIKKFQQQNGSIHLHQNSDVIHLHSLCYAMEGLIYTYYITKDIFYLNVCQNALEWCKSKIEKDGSLNLWFNSKFQQSKTSYHIAQVIRLMILLNKISNNQNFSESITKLYSFMLTLQSKQSESKVNGGFYEEYYKTIFGWKKRLRVNSWGSMFALQSIYWKENYESLTFKNMIEFLF